MVQVALNSTKGPSGEICRMANGVNSDRVSQSAARRRNRDWGRCIMTLCMGSFESCFPEELGAWARVSGPAGGPQRGERRFRIPGRDADKIVRYFLDISYNGKNYHGWQVQPGVVTLQATLQAAMETALRVPVRLVGSGRTDAGVHALHQVAHFDAPQPLEDIPGLVHRLNVLLPKDIGINALFPVSSSLHARFDAVSRTYRYRIHQHKDPFLSEFSYLLKSPLDVDAIKECCKIIREMRDFAKFAIKTEKGASTLCEIRHIEWSAKEGGHELLVTANRFLRGMVRAMVGKFIQIGMNRVKVHEFIQETSAESPHHKPLKIVPAHGLTFLKAEYPGGGQPRPSDA